MQTNVFKINPEDIDMSLLKHAASILRSGGLVAFPTETVYGLGANALDAKAVEKIFTAKGRPSTNPIIVHVASVSAAQELLSQWPAVAQKLADRFWPGPLSIALPKSSHIPDIVTAGGPTVAIRIPSHPVARALLELVGVPIAAPSANLSMEISPTLAVHVLKGLDGKIDAIIDGGSCPGGIESTVITLATDPPTLLRPGLITLRALESAIGKVQSKSHSQKSQNSSEEIAQSPGMMDRHYAPRAGLEVTESNGASRVHALTSAGLRIGWLKFGDELDGKLDGEFNKGETALTINMPTVPEGYAARIYAALHEMDEFGVDHIVAELPPNTDDWVGVLDRLKRAVH